MESELLNCSIIDSVSVSVSVIPFPDSGFHVLVLTIEKRKMKVRWISSNSRGLLSKSSYILHPNRRYFKGGLLICFVVHMKRASNQDGER